MKLSLKVNYILLPVIIIVFFIAGHYAYFNQRSLIVDTVAKEIQYTGEYIIDDILDDFVKQSTFLEIILEGQILLSCLANDLSEESAIVTSDVHLIGYLNELNFSYGSLKTMSLINENNQFIFHYDATDPFSTPKTDQYIDSHQNNVITQIKENGLDYINITSYFIRNDENNNVNLVVLYSFIPQHIYKKNTQLGERKLVTVVLETTIDIEKRYENPLLANFGEGTEVNIVPTGRATLLSDVPISSQVKEKNMVMTLHTENEVTALEITLPRSYLQKLLEPYQVIIFTLVLSLSIATFLLLKFLIQRQIIFPIVSLTKKVEEIIEGDRNKLTLLDGKGEVTLLNNSYALLLDKLNDMARIDGLTGLFNRFLFMESLERVVSYSAHNDTKSALFYIDLDNFKAINDHYGHHVGDNILITFSQRLTHLLKQSSIKELDQSSCDIARLAGDEFAVLVTNIPNNDAIVLIATSIIELCTKGYNAEGRNLDIKLSIGIAVCPDDGAGAEELLKHASATVYQVKGNGKNGYQFYSKQLDEQINRHAIVDSYLKKALYEEAFYLVWMPIYDCRTGEVVGAEALLRTNLPELESMGPAEFIPIAEETGLIKEIDYWVIESAIIKLKTLIGEYNFSGLLSVNFSAWELKNHFFAQDIALLLEKHQVPAHQLELEITETCLVSDDKKAKAILQELETLNIKLALDDFGTGYTAFNELANYPVDTLKVDRLFTNAIFDDQKKNNHRPLIDIVVELAFLYSLDVVAEGVETQEQLNYIRKLGCDRAQGFFLSKPILWEEFIELMYGASKASVFLGNDDEHHLEFKSSVGSVSIDTFKQILIIEYKGIITIELLSFVIKSIPSCILNIKANPWGIVIVSDSRYEFSLTAREKLKELFALCFSSGCIDGSYVITEPETINQMKLARAELGAEGDFDEKNFATLAEAKEYITQKLNL